MGDGLQKAEAKKVNNEKSKSKEGEKKLAERSQL